MKKPGKTTTVTFGGAKAPLRKIYKPKASTVVCNGVVPVDFVDSASCPKGDEVTQSSRSRGDSGQAVVCDVVIREGYVGEAGILKKRSGGVWSLDKRATNFSNWHRVSRQWALEVYPSNVVGTNKVSEGSIGDFCVVFGNQ
jgi:hypothetical protein